MVEYIVWIRYGVVKVDTYPDRRMTCKRIECLIVTRIRKMYFSGKRRACNKADAGNSYCRTGSDHSLSFVCFCLNFIVLFVKEKGMAPLLAT
jgi:hypothetical protein